MTSPRTVDDKLDDVAPFPELRRLRKAVGDGGWKPVAQQFTAFTDDHARAVAVRAAAEVAGGERLFQAAARTDGGALAQLLLAARHIELGWASRGHGRGADLERDQALYFLRRLREAERLLIEVCAAEPDNVPAWELRLTTAMGLGLDPVEQQRRYDRLAARNPHHYTAQFRRLQMLCPKWGGTWEQALAFARDASARAAPGGLGHTLIPTVYLERWLAADGSAKGLLDNRAVRDEVARAARASVLHADFGRPYRYLQAQGVFALYYSLIDKPKLAAPHFRAMGTLAGWYPWGLFNDSARLLARHRSAALGSTAHGKD